VSKPGGSVRSAATSSAPKPSKSSAAKPARKSSAAANKAPAKPSTKTAAKTATRPSAKSPTAKTASAKPSKTPARSTVSKTPLSAPLSDNRRAGIAKRKATLDKTAVHGIDALLRVDPDDSAARAAIDRHATRWARAARVALEVPTDDDLPSPRIKRTAVDRLTDPPPASGLTLIDRVTHAIERELTQIELIVGGVKVKPAQRTEAERRARTLASLARTLTEVRKMRAEEQASRPDDDAIPRDLDELRRALSRRLEQMVASPAQFPAAGDE
jgi:hypothetical protein